MQKEYRTPQGSIIVVPEPSEIGFGNAEVLLSTPDVEVIRFETTAKYPAPVAFSGAIGEYLVMLEASAGTVTPAPKRSPLFAMRANTHVRGFVATEQYGFRLCLTYNENTKGKLLPVEEI